MGILDDILIGGEASLPFLKATNPNTRNRFMFNFDPANAESFAAYAKRFGDRVRRQRVSDEYLRNRNNTPPEYREGYVKPDEVRVPVYDFGDFMDSRAGSDLLGLVSDVGTATLNIEEGIGTGLNKMNRFAKENMAVPVANYFLSSSGEMPFNLKTPDQIKSDAAKLDTTFDVTKNPFPEDSLVNKFKGSKYVKSTLDFIKNQFDTGSPDMPNISLTGNQDIGTTIVNKLDKDVNNGEIKTIDQSGVNTIINATSEASGAGGVIANASNKVTEAIGTKEKDQTVLDKLNSGIDTFLNDLDKPGFQVALAMHMEAKNGGDITSVLFEGMKVKKKATKDLLAAHANNLAVTRAELEIMKLYQNLTKADEPSANLIKIATGMMEKDFELGDQSSGAGLAISSLAMSIKRNENISEYEALMKAIQLAESTKALEKDKWYTWGGKFDYNKLFTGNEPAVSTNTPVTKADMLKQLMAANPNTSQTEILEYINTTYPSIQ
tara:strand:+ start:2445 stop:3923 length:1479 start_codon:yes stop_codon:yes gene_type:complete